MLTAIQLGPFTGGINSLSDEASAAPNEMVDCQNLEIALDGSLTGRPPIVKTVGDGTWISNIIILGYLSNNNGIFQLGSTTDAVWARAVGSTTWTKIVSYPSNKVVQYQDSAYIIRSDTSVANAGGRWDGDAYTAMATIPTGESGLVFKDRLWVFKGPHGTSNQSRLYWSKPTDFSNYTAPDGGFVDVGPGDGTAITAIIAQRDALYIFKTNSTWVLTFDADPGAGNLRQISPTIGTVNSNTVAIHENSIFTLHNAGVYEILNYNFSKINKKVPFDYDISAPGNFDGRVSQSLSAVGDRLVVRYFNRVYVYYTYANAWSRWVSNNYFGPLVRSPVLAAGSDDLVYESGSVLSNDFNLYSLRDGFDVTTTEDMICLVRTKNYDLDRPERFKRLGWWGADIGTHQKVTGTTVVISVRHSVSYADLKIYTYGDLKVGTYASPTADSVVSEEVSTGGKSTTFRKFVKFLRALRFRQIYFTVLLKSDGTEAVQFFSIRAYVDTKERVPAQVS